MEIAIRKFEQDDAGAFLMAVQDSIDHVSPWLPWCDSEYDFEKAQYWVADSISAWDEGREYRYLIVEKTTQEILGSVAINQIVQEHRIGNIGYWVSKKALGKNVCTEAVKELISQAFQVWRFQRLEILVAEENKASCRVAEKVGAVLEGVFKNKLRLYDKPMAAKCYSILPADG